MFRKYQLSNRNISSQFNLDYFVWGGTGSVACWEKTHLAHRWLFIPTYLHSTCRRTETEQLCLSSTEGMFTLHLRSPLFIYGIHHDVQLEFSPKELPTCESKTEIMRVVSGYGSGWYVTLVTEQRLKAKLNYLNLRLEQCKRLDTSKNERRLKGKTPGKGRATLPFGCESGHLVPARRKVLVCPAWLHQLGMLSRFGGASKPPGGQTYHLPGDTAVIVLQLIPACSITFRLSLSGWSLWGDP